MNKTSTIISDIAGDGFPLVMLHGLGGSSNTFQPLMSSLSSYATYRPDMPGSARSGLPQGRLTIASLIADIAGWIDTLKLARFHLAGHSMGTLICQGLAALWPDRIAGMVLFGALTTPPDAARAGLLARAKTARSDGMAGIADTIVAQTLAPKTHETNAAAVAFVRESIMRQPSEGYARNCEALSAAQPADWRRITAPTLLITGDTDPVAPPSMTRILSENIKHTETEVLQSCGHWTPLEQPRECAALVAAFLQRHGH
jgi:pimeloyl-ACP methyl ester carboxylesterase